MREIGIPGAEAFRRRILSVLVLLSLSACGYDTLYSDLDEQQSNEMLALLMDNGISSRKIRGEDAWQLEIKRDDLPLAMDVLRSHGYPRDRYETLGQVFRKEGFVSSPLEERARLLHGLSQELSQTLTEIDGVVTARVHLAIPEQNALSDTRNPSSASVFIKHHANADVALKTAAIKALVVNSVEGLPYENVTVSFFAATAASLPARAPEPAMAAALTLPVGQWPVFAGLGSAMLLLLFLLVVRQRRRQPRHLAAHRGARQGDE